MRSMAAFMAGAVLYGWLMAGCASAPEAGSGGGDAYVDRESVPEGVWNGHIAIGTQKLEISVTFRSRRPLEAEIDIPAQRAFGLPLKNVRYENGDIHFELPAGPSVAVFDGAVDGDEIKGAFSQSGTNGTFVLTRSRAPGGESTESDASAVSAAGTEEAVSITAGKATVYGTLLVPENARAAVPVALIISGSGPTDRDGNSAMLPGRNDSLKLLAHSLADRGIASLRYDKRGVGESAAALSSEADLRFGDYVNDAVEWLELLRADDRFSGIGVVGHSEGALIGMLAVQDHGAQAYVGIAGTGRPAADLIREQLSSQPEAIRESAYQILEALQEGKTVDDIGTKELEALFRPSVQPYLISWFVHDPAEIVAELDVPVQIIQGRRDLQVTERDAELLLAARPSAQLVLIDDMNHVLKKVSADPADNQRAYTDPAYELPEMLVNAVAGFLLQHCR